MKEDTSLQLSSKSNLAIDTVSTDYPELTSSLLVMIDEPSFVSHINAVAQNATLVDTINEIHRMAYERGFQVQDRANQDLVSNALSQTSLKQSFDQGKVKANNQAVANVEAFRDQFRSLIS